MGESKRRSYSKAEREAAVADVPTLGVSGAAEKHGAPQSCVSKWAKDAGVRREVGARPATQARKGKVTAPKRRAKRAPLAGEAKRDAPVSAPEVATVSESA